MKHQPPCVDCGGRLGYLSTGVRCRPCADKLRAARYPVIERLWNEGLSVREIAERLGTTPGSAAQAINRMRGQGYDLPYRYVMKDGRRVAA